MEQKLPQKTGAPHYSPQASDHIPFRYTPTASYVTATFRLSTSKHEHPSYHVLKVHRDALIHR